MLIRTSRLVLRDFALEDRPAFIAYQTDPRYRRLYDIVEGDDRHAHELFERFAAWRTEMPRRNFQIGIFTRSTGRLCGCAGLRTAGVADGIAAMGVELTPDDWGRYRLAIEAAAALIDYGFGSLGLHRIVGSTASGNKRVERLARWFGAEIVARRPGPAWMAAKGWSEVDWTLTRDDWERLERQGR